MLNYEVERGLLKQYVPSGTSLDTFEGRTYVSLVGFRFYRTKLFGSFPVPLYADFDEVNLRFYVRREAGGEVHVPERIDDRLPRHDRKIYGAPGHWQLGPHPGLGRSDASHVLVLQSVGA